MIVGQIALEIVALWLALRSRARVLAVVLAYAVVDELLVAGLHASVLSGAPKPFTGWVRVGYHLETAIVLGWPAVLAGASWDCILKSFGAEHKTLKKTRIPIFAVGAVWVLAVVVLALVFPLPKGWTAPTLHAIDGLFVAVAVVALGVGFRRRALQGVELAALGCLVAVELVVATCGAWGQNVFTDWETLARVPHSIGLIAAISVLAYSERR